MEPTNKEGVKRKRGRPATGAMPIRWYRMHDDHFHLVKRAADLSGMSVADFTRDTLTQRSRRVLGEK